MLGCSLLAVTTAAQAETPATIAETEAAAEAAEADAAAATTTTAAQTTAAQTSAADVGGDGMQAANQDVDIIVTARKREESLQDVPASVTAFSSDRLLALGIRDITEVSLQTPGFAMQNASRQNEQPFIRGMSANSVFRQAQNASFFVDGIYVSGVGRTVGLDDVERIEVVLGPQAVYFGRATFAGAINYVTAKPILGRGAFNARSTIGEHGLFDLSGSINIPLGETAAIRLYGQYHNYEGEYRNSLDGRKLGTENTEGFSGSFRWQPTPDLDIIARYQGTTFDDGHSPTTIYNPTLNNNCRPNAAGRFQFYCGRLRNPRESDIALNLDQLFGGKGYRRVQQNRYSLLANWNIGDFQLSSVTGYNNERQQLNSDGDATRFRPQGGVAAIPVRVQVHGHVPGIAVELPAGKPAPRGDRWILFRFHSHRQLAALPDRLAEQSAQDPQLFGLRLASVRYPSPADPDGRRPLSDGSIRVENTALRAKFNSFLPRATLDFKPTEDLLFYATVGKGNKPGDFNTAAGVPQGNSRVLEEELWNYEVGAKTQFFDRRLTVNATGYWIDWTNQSYQDTLIQRDAAGNIILAPNGQPRTVVATINAGETRIKGAELDATLIILPGWSARLAYSYNDAKFRDFVSRLPITFAGAPAQVAGNRLFNSPKHKVTVSTTFERPVGDSGLTFSAVPTLPSGASSSPTN
jgi:outer membrane receptor protein involved in Fe transport